MIWYLVATLVIGAVFTALLFVRGKASWGSKSSSLTLLRVVVGFSFFVILLDTANDLGIVAIQSSPTALQVPRLRRKKPPVTKAGTKPPKSRPRVSGRNRRPSTAAGRSKPAAIRAVTDRKYELVGTLVLLAFLLYLLGRKETWGFVLDLVLGVRGIDSRANRMQHHTPDPGPDPVIDEPEMMSGGLAPPDPSSGDDH